MWCIGNTGKSASLAISCFKLQNICSYSFLYSIYSLSAYVLLQSNILLILSELCGHQNLYNHELLAYSMQKQGGRRVYIGLGFGIT